MSEEADFELVRGSGNVFRDFDDPDADLKQAKAVLAANIIAALDERQLTVREANRLTGFAAADFSRVRNANLRRFTLDRLMRMFSALGNASVAIHVGNASVAIHVGNGLAMDRRSIIIDKSYAQGTSGTVLSKLADDWNLILPDVLLFEIASTDAVARRQCLRKLRQLNRDGTLRIGPDVGELLRKELSTLTPAGTPSENLPGLHVDDFLRTGFGNLSGAQRQTLDQAKRDLTQDAMNIVRKGDVLRGWLRDIIPHEEPFDVVKRYVTTDRAFIVRLLDEFVCGGDSPPPKAPVLSRIARSPEFGPRWAIYRWLQVQLLYGLELAKRYKDIDTQALSRRTKKKLDNEAADMDYLVLGLLQGAIATKDGNLQDRFSLLNPDGILLSSSP